MVGSILHFVHSQLETNVLFFEIHDINQLRLDAFCNLVLTYFVLAFEHHAQGIFPRIYKS